MSMSVDNNNKYRIKIRYPEGTELEIEGSEKFIIEQKKEILKEFGKMPNTITETQDLEKSMRKIIDFKDNMPYIKTRFLDLDIKMAILIILTAYKVIQKIFSISAIELSKSIKISGYAPKRIDREAISLIKDSSIRAEGTKRNRKYTLTDIGFTKASVKIFNIEKSNTK